MLKEPTPTRIDGLTLSEEVYRLALQQIEPWPVALRIRPKSAS